jgi:hypothetical protein
VISHFSHRPAEVDGQFGTFFFGHDRECFGYDIRTSKIV